jgi:hypothetical protein
MFVVSGSPAANAGAVCAAAEPASVAAAVATTEAATSSLVNALCMCVSPT